MLCAAIGIIRMGVVFPSGGSASYPGGTTPNPIQSPVRDQSERRQALPVLVHAHPTFCTPAIYNTSKRVVDHLN